MEQLAIQQQIELLQQQQQQIQATHQQYVNMGMIPPTQHLAPNGQYNPLQPQMQNQPNAYQYPNQPMNAPMGAPTQPLSHRRNQSALPNMGMGPPPAPSSGAAGTGFNDFGPNNRENVSARGGRGGGPPGGGHQRRHSLALPEAKKAAEMAQQKRTTSGFQFPIPGATGATPTDGQAAASPVADDKNGQGQSTGNHVPSSSSIRGRGSGHGRSQSMAVNSRGGAMRGGGNFQFPPMPAPAEAGPATQSQGNNFERRSSSTERGGHNRNSSRNFEGNWRNQPPQAQQQDQQGQMGNFQGQQQQGNFQPGHRNRGSVNQSISSIPNFQYGAQPQLVQLPQGQMALVQPQLYPGQQLNPMQMNQLQALQAAQMSGQANMQGGHHGQQANGQQQQQQRKTLFTPYLPQATLPALLGDGQLVSGILRVNKKNRSDAYVSTQDGLLDADIFICGSKDRNRALEGDLVAVELLDVDEVWGQKREKEEKKKRKDITDTRGGSNNGNNERSHRDNSTNGDDQPAAPEGGMRRRGSLRQRPTQKKNDDVEVEGQSLLLVEEEEVNDVSALVFMIGGRDDFVRVLGVRTCVSHLFRYLKKENQS